jgi:hypothetical protein
MLAAFGIPLVVVPLRQAKAFRWEIPHSKNLVTTLGRSLGLTISLVAVFAFKAVSIPEAKPFFFDFLLWLIATNTVLHFYGTIRKIQPVTETIEIFLWVVLFFATLSFYPV